MAVERLVDPEADEVSLRGARAPAAKPYPAPSQSERRVDPEDGLAYSFSQFAKLNRDYFEESEIIEYWFDTMRIDPQGGTALFVDGLGTQVADAELRTAFERFGEVSRCEIFRSPETRESKGFATVCFSSAQAAGEALAKMNGAELRQQRLAVRQLDSRQGGASVFVGALPSGTGAADVETALSRCGHVMRCELLKADDRLRLKTQARVDFIFPESASEAVHSFHMKDGAFKGSTIVVSEWREDDNGKRAPGPNVFVARVDPSTSEEEVWGLFESAGVVVVDVHLFRNKGAIGSATIGKVELGDAESCRLATEKLHGAELRGTSIIVREFGQPQPGGLQAAPAPAQGAGPERGARAPATQHAREPDDHAVFVTGLGAGTTEEQLRAHFAGIGAGPIHCRVFTYANRVSRGQAKVCFGTQEEQNRAIAELNHTILDGSSLKLRAFIPDLASRQAAFLEADAGPQFGFEAAEDAAVADDSRDKAVVEGLGYAVFVSRLNPETTADSLRQHCHTCGAVFYVRVLIDRETRQSRGLAKVVFAAESSARAAVEELDDSELDGSRIRVARHRGAGGGASGDGKSIYQENMVFVTNLDPNTSFETLKAHLQQCGEVAAGHLFTDKISGCSRGQARIAFMAMGSAQKAIAELDGQELEGRKLHIRHYHSTSGSLIHDTNAVFVGGLFPDTTSEMLKQHFGKCGRVVLATAGKRIGYGKVIYADHTAKLRALNELNGTWLDGRALTVQDFHNLGDRSGKGRPPVEEPAQATSGVMFVTGLSPEVTSEDLREHFEVCGRVLYANLYFDQHSGQPLGNARVAFSTASAKARAIQDLDGRELRGQVLRLREFLPQVDEGGGVLRWRGEHEQCYVLVSGLGFDTTIEQLTEHFRECGQIVQAHLHMDRETRRLKGSARIAFSSWEGKSAAVTKLHGSELDGYVISVRDDSGPEFGVRGKGKGVKGKGEGGRGRFSVYVSGLSPTTDEAQLAEHFAACGEIEASMVFFDKATGHSKCSGKVCFTSESAMRRAVAERDGAKLDGCITTVREFGKPPANKRFAGPAVFVSGLHPSTDDEALRKHFEGAGRVVSAFVVRDQWDVESRCMGKVTFASETIRERVLREWNGSSLNGNFITVRDWLSTGKGGGKHFAPPFRDELHGDGFRPGAEHGSAGSDAAPSGEEETKVDPDDGGTYTFAEFMAKHRGAYSDQELREYWASECKAVPAGRHGEGPRPAVAGMTAAEWLSAVHSSLLVYREAIEESYTSLGQVLSLHASTGSGGLKQLDAGFFERAGITRIAHKRLINKWITEST